MAQSPDTKIISDLQLEHTPMHITPVCMFINSIINKIKNGNWEEFFEIVLFYCIIHVYEVTLSHD